jgi:hypothetical protein
LVSSGEHRGSYLISDSLHVCWLKRFAWLKLQPSELSRNSQLVKMLDQVPHSSAPVASGAPGTQVR